MKEISASANTKTGNYKDLKYAHLEHDDDKFNGNEDIDYTMSKFNSHLNLIAEGSEYESEEDFIDKNYDEPIRKLDEKHKERRQYKRMHGSYEAYVEHREEVMRKKGSKRPYGRDRLLTRKYGMKEDNDEIVKYFVDRGATKEEVTTALVKGFEDSTRAFNERYKGQMMITESFIHADEHATHSHDHLYAIGFDRRGKPRTDINQSLMELYGGTKYKYDKDGKAVVDGKTGKPKEFKKNNRDIWKAFRDEMDKSTVEHVNAKLIELAKEKDIDFEAPKFVRKEVEDYEEHDAYKAKAKDKEREIELLTMEFGHRKLNSNDNGSKTEPIEHEKTQALLKSDKVSIDEVQKIRNAFIKQRKERLEKEQEKLDKREELLWERRNKIEEEREELKERESKVDERSNELDERGKGLEVVEHRLDEREANLNNEAQKFEKMYKKPIYYAFAEDVKNRYFKALNNPGEEEKRFNKFKKLATEFGKTTDYRKIQRVQRELKFNGNETVTHKEPTVKAKDNEKDFDIDF